MILDANNIYATRAFEWHYFYIKILNNIKVTDQNVSLVAPKNVHFFVNFTQNVNNKKHQQYLMFPLEDSQKVE